MWSPQNGPGQEASKGEAEREPDQSRLWPKRHQNRDSEADTTRAPPPPKPCPAPGPPHPTHSLLTGLSLPLQDSSPRCPALCPAGRPPPQTLTHPRLPSFPSFLFLGASPSLPAGFLGPQISRASRTTTTTTANRTLEQLEELFSAEASLPLLE